MTKKIFIAFIALVMLPAYIVAQDTLQKPFRFGYFSYEQVMKSIDYYAIARHGVDELRAQYAAEAKRSEEDFNTKYESFIEEQAGLAPNIRKKRQAELMDLMDRNTNFKKEAERLIKEAERSANDSLCTIIDAAAREIGAERGYAFIINTDNHNLPFVNPAQGEDISAALEAKLSKQ